MSLTDDERRACIDDFRAALDDSDLTVPQVLHSLGWSRDHLVRVMDLHEVDPAEPWLLRDFLVQVARDWGDPVPHFHVLTNAARAEAAGEIAFKQVPPTPTRLEHHD